MNTPNGSIQFPNSNIRRRIVFWETANNDHQVVAIGKDSSTMNFQNAASTDDFVFQVGASATTSTEVFRIKGNGRVGIGCNAPSHQLDVLGSARSQLIGNNSTVTVHLGVLGTSASPYNVPFTSIGDGPSSGAAFDTGAYGMLQLVRNGNQGDSRGYLSFVRAGNMVVIQGYLSNSSTWALQSWNTSNTTGFFYDTNNSRFGINTSNTVCALDIGGAVNTMAILRTSASDAGARSTLNAAATDANLWPMQSGNTIYMYWRGGGTAYRYTVAGSSTGWFTGQHANVSVDSNLQLSNLSSLTGCIVSSADNGYTSFDKNNSTITGKNAIWISESLPNIKLTNTDQDKAVWGVITNHKSGSYNTDGTPDIDQQSEWSDPLGNRFRVNGVGEGAIWVTNINGNLENGDYICSSVIPGLGRKQNDDLLHNYTVAKITMSCSFDLEQDNYICEEFTFNDTVYRKAFVGCTYHCS
jgi:hypothetical protein